MLHVACVRVPVHVCVFAWPLAPVAILAQVCFELCDLSSISCSNSQKQRLLLTAAQWH